MNVEIGTPNSFWPQDGIGLALGRQFNKASLKVWMLP